jgi:excisionase family DNA binding protein
MSDKIVVMPVEELLDFIEARIQKAINAQGQTYSIKETAKQLRVSVPTVTALIAKGNLRATKAGKRFLVSQLAINEFHKSGGVDRL